MPLFWKPYTSDVTAFIDEMKKRRPALDDEQKRGRALLWDRPIDRAAEADYEDGRVRQQAYVYQTRRP